MTEYTKADVAGFARYLTFRDDVELYVGGDLVITHDLLADEYYQSILPAWHVRARYERVQPVATTLHEDCPEFTVGDLVRNMRTGTLYVVEHGVTYDPSYYELVKGAATRSMPAMINEYAEDNPVDGDYGNDFQRQHAAPEAFAALRRITEICEYDIARARQGWEVAHDVLMAIREELSSTSTVRAQED